MDNRGCVDRCVVHSIGGDWSLSDHSWGSSLGGRLVYWSRVGVGNNSASWSWVGIGNNSAHWSRGIEVHRKGGWVLGSSTSSSWGFVVVVVFLNL